MTRTTVTGTAARLEGFVALPDLFGADATERLLDEAAGRRASAREWASAGYSLGRRGQLSSPRRHRSCGPGPVLRELHESTHVARLLRSLTGRHMFATRTSYLFYAPGDFIGLHTDIDPCQVTLVTSVHGRPEPLVLHPELADLPAEELLVLHPELADLPAEELLELSRRSDGQPAGGLPVAVPCGGALVLRGSRVPHRRPRAEADCAIATLCYAALA